MKRIIKICLITIIFCFFIVSKAFSAEENQAYEQALVYDFGEIENITNKRAEEYGIDIDFKEVLRDRMKAGDKRSEESIIHKVSDLFFSELKKQGALLKNVIIICVLSGIFKALTDSFKTSEISEIGFYACYIASIMLLINSFTQGLEIMKDTVFFISELTKAVAPVLALIMASCAEVSAGGIISPLLAFAMSLSLDFMTFFFIPGIKISAVISIVNYLGSKEMLKRLSEFISWILGLLLKIGSIAFMGIVSMGKISGASMDSAFSKTIQGGINAVPIIGDVFSGATESILGWSKLLKTGFGLSVVIICVILCAVPIIKILIFMLLYKITAILIEPFCDKRLTGCIDTLGNYMFMVLSGLTAILIMFIFSVVIIISSIGG